MVWRCRLNLSANISVNSVALGHRAAGESAQLVVGTMSKTGVFLLRNWSIK